MNNQWKKHIPGAVAGNVLELYEFIIYGYFANIIGSLFFPSTNKYTSLMIAFLVFATGSIVRPFSAIIFGYLGDKIGRRFSLIISVGLMATCTFCIGILPTYAQFGILSPILLVICRIGQGLSMTGEEIGAALFLMESAPLSHRGFASSLVLGSVYLGLLFGSIVSVIILSMIQNDALVTFGWRIPFLLGGIIGFIVLIIRIRQPESSEFKNALFEKTILQNPLKQLIKNDLSTVIRSTLLFCLISVAVYLFAVYIPNTIKTHLATSNKLIIMIICSFGFAITFIVSLFVGKLVDRIGYKIPITLGCSGFILFSYPLFLLFSTQDILTLFIGYSLFAILLGLLAGSVMFAAIKPFPVNVRFSGSCVAFNLSMSLFGGTAPILALYLTKITKIEASAAYLLITAALITITALFFERSIFKDIYHDNKVRYQNG